MLMPCKIYQHLCQHVCVVGHTVQILLDLTTNPFIESASSITQLLEPYLYITQTQSLKCSYQLFCQLFSHFCMFHGPDNRQLRNSPLRPIICLLFFSVYAIKIFILGYFVLLLDASCKGNLAFLLNRKLCILNCLCFYWIIIYSSRTYIYN